MNWFKSKSTKEAKNLFSLAIREGETIYLRVNGDGKVVLKYIFKTMTITEAEAEKIIIPMRDEEGNLIICSPELTHSLENTYQATLREEAKVLNKIKKDKEEAIKVAAMNESQKADYEVQLKVNSIIEAPDLIKKTKKDKIIALVQAGFKKKSEIQKYFPTDKSYLDDVFEKHIYGTLITFKEKLELEPQVSSFLASKIEVVEEVEEVEKTDQEIQEEDMLIAQQEVQFEAVKTPVKVVLSVKKGDIIKTKDNFEGKIVKYPSNSHIELEIGPESYKIITKEDILEVLK